MILSRHPNKCFLLKWFHGNRQYRLKLKFGSFQLTGIETLDAVGNDDVTNPQWRMIPHRYVPELAGLRPDLESNVQSFSPSRPRHGNRFLHRGLYHWCNCSGRLSSWRPGWKYRVFMNTSRRVLSVTTLVQSPENENYCCSKWIRTVMMSNEGRVLPRLILYVGRPTNLLLIITLQLGRRIVEFHCWKIPRSTEYHDLIRSSQ